MILRIAAAFGFWLACLVIVIPLLLAATVIALRDMAVEAWKRRRDRRRTDREIREYERKHALRGGEK